MRHKKHLPPGQGYRVSLGQPTLPTLSFRDRIFPEVTALSPETRPAAP